MHRSNFLEVKKVQNSSKQILGAWPESEYILVFG